MDKEKKLKDLNVVYFESRHSKTLGDLIAIQGGIPIAAPAMKEVPIENNAEALEFADKLLKNEIDILVLLTGVGTRALVTEGERVRRYGFLPSELDRAGPTLSGIPVTTL